MVKIEIIPGGKVDDKKGIVVNADVSQTTSQGSSLNLVDDLDKLSSSNSQSGQSSQTKAE